MKKDETAADGTEITSTIKYESLLFINPDIEIKARSNIVITQHGVTREFKRSGEPFLCETHQEIMLQRIDIA